MKRLRLSITGFGTVGQGLAELLSTKRDLLQQEYNLDITLVSVANARSGFIYREGPSRACCRAASPDCPSRHNAPGERAGRFASHRWGYTRRSNPHQPA